MYTKQRRYRELRGEIKDPEFVFDVFVDTGNARPFIDKQHELKGFLKLSGR